MKTPAEVKWYMTHRPDCRCLVTPISRSMAPWPVTKELRERLPEAYRKYVCTCGLEELLEQEALDDTYSRP